MVINIPAPPSHLIGIAFNREKGRRDFSGSDRQLLNLLRPHLLQAHRNALACTRMRQQLDLMRQSLEVSGQGVIVLDQEGSIRQTTKSARKWLAAYFGKQPSHSRYLPDDLRRWVAKQRSLLGMTDNVPSPCLPMVAERRGKRLVVRFLKEGSDRSLLLLREEHPTDLSPALLTSMGLGQREAEVLYWVARGKTNAEVATILNIKTRTVDKHLERIYIKLGVETRTAAISHALETIGILRREASAGSDEE